MQTFNIAAQAHHLKNFSDSNNLQAITSEQSFDIIKNILKATPTSISWNALLELFAAWPDTTDIKSWVSYLEERRDHWPWHLRQSILGQAQTQNEKNCVYRLVGQLMISNVDDSTGQQSNSWSENKNWENLQGISLYKVETEVEYVNNLLASPHLQNLQTLELKTLGAYTQKIGLLFNNLQLPKLRELHVISLGLQAADILEIGKAPLAKQLTLLDISSNYIATKDLEFILDPKTFPNLETINLSYCRITENGWQDFLTKLHHPKLKKIIFEGTEVAKSLGKDTLPAFYC